MHHDSDKPDAEIAALRLYLDESGGSDPGTPHATLGGMLMDRRAFLPFEEAWDQMLERHDIRDGIHMKGLGKHGKLGGLSVCCRRELFEEACYLITRHRALTLVGSLTNQEYEANIPDLARESFSVYGMLFNLVVMMNHRSAMVNNYGDQIPIIMDAGNPHKGHVIDAHAFMLKQWQSLVGDLHLGSLTFDDDKVLNVLQAADMIAWGTRRKASQLSFMPGLEPLQKLLDADDPHHMSVPFNSEWLRELGNKLAELIASEKGAWKTDR
jgi:hypothetical protein